jgi:hypothetical protein
MTVLKRLIELVEQFQVKNELELNELVRELGNTLNHFKLRLAYNETKKHQANYIDKPWF